MALAVWDWSIFCQQRVASNTNGSSDTLSENMDIPGSQWHRHCVWKGGNWFKIFLYIVKSHRAEKQLLKLYQIW